MDQLGSISTFLTEDQDSLSFSSWESEWDNNAPNNPMGHCENENLEDDNIEWWAIHLTEFTPHDLRNLPPSFVLQILRRNMALSYTERADPFFRSEWLD